MRSRLSSFPCPENFTDWLWMEYIGSNQIAARKEWEMRGQLLDTKFALPPVHQRRVVRQRLLEQLCGAHTLDRQYRLTLLSAPAGSGKSTLLCDWVYSDSHVYGIS